MLSKNKKYVMILAGSILVILLLLAVALIAWNTKKPILSLEAPSHIYATDRKEFNINVTLSELPENNYPAASISVDFDRNKLEFCGAKLGTMMASSTDSEYMIPEWSCNTQISNQKSYVNAMYLDMTAGDHSYNSGGFERKRKDIMLRLSFRLKDSSIQGDKYVFSIRDATIATVGGDQNGSSLSTVSGTLRTKDAVVRIK